MRRPLMSRGKEAVRGDQLGRLCLFTTPIDARASSASWMRRRAQPALRGPVHHLQDLHGILEIDQRAGAELGH